MRQREVAQSGEEHLGQQEERHWIAAVLRDEMATQETVKRNFRCTQSGTE